MFELCILFTVVISNVITAKNVSDMHPLSDEFIEHINSKQNLWRAGRNFPQDVPTSYIHSLMGSLRDYRAIFLPLKTYDGDLKRLPKEFDARVHWNGCPTLNDIRDQGACGGCWAVSAVSAMTDRICIKSNGAKNFYLSAEDVISCCYNCGQGCSGGGLLSNAWLFAKRKGVVSGGGYGSNQGCRPYEFKPQHGIPTGETPKTPVCKKMCQPNYKHSYKSDKRRIMEVYALNHNTHVKKEILTNGPVTSTFTAYSDFLNYKSGVYYHVSGTYLGYHSVKIIGWGIENNVKYWLVANSWNTDWGENGFFKIRRGKNECGIENLMVTGKPGI